MCEQDIHSRGSLERPRSFQPTSDPRTARNFDRPSFVLTIMLFVGIAAIAFCLWTSLLAVVFFRAEVAAEDSFLLAEAFLVITIVAFAFATIGAIVAGVVLALLEQTMSFRFLPATFGALAGAAASCTFVIPSLLTRSGALHFWMVVCAAGLFGQAGGAYGAARYMRRYPEEIQPRKGQFGIRQLLVFTTWCAIAVALLAPLELAKAATFVSDFLTWTVVQLAAFFLARSLIRRYWPIKL